MSKKYSNYFLISINRIKKKIQIQYVKLNLISKSYTVVFFTANNSQELLKFINSHFLMISYTDKSHYLYLCIELIKAEICLKLNQIYIQS